jgi:primosomal replication protein N
MTYVNSQVIDKEGIHQRGSHNIQIVNLCEGHRSVANLVILSGHVSARGPHLSYRLDGRAVCQFILEVDNTTKAGKHFQQLISIEVWGSQAEETAASLEAGQMVLIQGSLGFRSEQKIRQPCIITWAVEILSPAPAQSPN